MEQDLDSRARTLHDWFCRSTGQQVPLRMPMLTAWIDWLLAGHNGPEMALVIRYLRREIAAGRRNPGSVALRHLLDIETFEKDLGLAQMHKAGGFDPEKRLTAPPDSTTVAAPVTGPIEPPATVIQHHPPDHAARAARIAELEELKRSME